MKLTEFFTGVMYLVATSFCVLFMVNNVGILALYWTRLVIFIIMGIYAIINLVSFWGIKKNASKSPVSKKAKYAKFFELIMGSIFLIVFLFELLFT